MNNSTSSLFKTPPPPKPTSVKSLAAIFTAAFIIILVFLNAPTIIKSIAYPFNHSPESDNEQLTQQYRDIYGYEKHPELCAHFEWKEVGMQMQTSHPLVFWLKKL